MFLADIDGIREQLGFDQMVDIDNAIEAALNSATAQLAGLLQTSFDEEDMQDVFWVEKPPIQQGPHRMTEFRLSRGFVSSLSAATRTEVEGLFQDEQPSDVLAAIKLDRDKGHARDWTTWYNRNYVTFAYRSGFPRDAANPASYDLSAVPTWLQEAAKLNTLILMADHPTLTEAQIKLDTSMLAAQLDAMLTPKLRYTPTALMPL